MNLVFIIGKIISEIEFKFVLKSKNISIASFNVELINKSVIKVKGYNEIADFCYGKLEIGNFVIISGEINTNSEIEINQIENFTQNSKYTIV